jgi:hypothetical protein
MVVVHVVMLAAELLVVTVEIGARLARARERTPGYHIMVLPLRLATSPPPPISYQADEAQIWMHTIAWNNFQMWFWDTNRHRCQAEHADIQSPLDIVVMLGRFIHTGAASEVTSTRLFWGPINLSSYPGHTGHSAALGANLPTITLEGGQGNISLSTCTTPRSGSESEEEIPDWIDESEEQMPPPLIDSDESEEEMTFLGGG